MGEKSVFSYYLLKYEFLRKNVSTNKNIKLLFNCYLEQTVPPPPPIITGSIFFIEQRVRTQNKVIRKKLSALQKLLLNVVHGCTWEVKTVSASLNHADWNRVRCNCNHDRRRYQIVQTPVATALAIKIQPN